MGLCAWPLLPDQRHGRWPHSRPPAPTGKTEPSPADRQGLLLQPSQRTRAGMGCLCAEGGEPRSVPVPLQWDWTECLPTKLPEEKRCSPVRPSGPNIRKIRKRSPSVSMASLPWQACCCSGPVCAVPAGAELCPGNSPPDKAGGPLPAHKAPTQRKSRGIQALALHAGHLFPSGIHCRTAAPTRSVLEEWGGEGAEPWLSGTPRPRHRRALHGAAVPFLSVSVAWTRRMSPDPPRTSGPSSPCRSTAEEGVGQSTAVRVGLGTS